MFKNLSTIQRDARESKYTHAFYSRTSVAFKLAAVVAGFSVVIFIFPQSVFAATQAGEAKVTVNNGIANRCWTATTDTSRESTGACSATSDKSFEVAAGSPITLKMLELGEVGGPSAATTITLQIREEDTSTITQTLTWTTDSTVTFTPSESGTYRIYIEVVRTDIPTYAAESSDSDGNKGYLRAGTTLSESNNARSPAAYTDSVTSTMTLGHTPNQSNSVTMSFRQATDQVSSSTPSSATTAFTHQDTIDSTFANSSTAVKSRISFSNSAFSGVPWTHITTLPSGFASVTQTATGNYTALEKTTAFTADPRLTFSGVTPGQTVYNRGETASTTFSLLNSQSENLTGSISWIVRDSNDTTITTETDTGPTYGDGGDDGYAIGASDDAANTTTGNQWDIQTSISDAHAISTNTYSVSSLLRISTVSTGTIDHNTQSYTTSGYSTSATVFNRAEAVYNQFYLYGVRGQLITDSSAIGTTLSLQPRNTLNSSEGSAVSVSADSNGRVRWNYTVAAGHTAAADTTGSAKNFTLTKTGNSLYQGSGGTEGSGAEWNVSSLYFIDAHPEIDTTLSADDWPTEDANETTSAVIAADLFSFFAHVKNVRKDTNIDTSGSAITFTVKKPDGTTSATQTSDTGSDGWTSNYDFSPVAPSGTWTLTADVSSNSNTATDTENLTFVSPYTGNYQIESVGWNQTYDIGDTARFTIRTLSRASGSFAAVAADSAPTYELRYWDGATWQSLASGSMTALSATATYETTYAIPNDSAWIGRKVSFNASVVMSGTRVNDTREIEIVGSPAQVVINSVSDLTVPTISASVRITNEGTAAFEYTYEYCIVTSDTNECGGSNDTAYGSAAKLIQAGANFDTTLTLNITDAGNYYFKVAVWWSNQSSKASNSFTATSATTVRAAEEEAAVGGGGYTGGTAPVAQAADQNTFAAVWQKIAEILSRLLGLETKMTNLEIRVAALEKQLGSRVIAQAPSKEITLPKILRPQPKTQTPTPLFKIRLK